MLPVLRSAFPDLTMTPEEIIAEGDTVAARFVMQGTNTGEFMGMPPTGKRINIAGFDINRFADGKLVEHWGLTDFPKLMQQLGIEPPAGEGEG